jgi:RAMP superfamily
MPEHFALTALSPIHIGSGRVLYQHLGFGFREREQVLAFDPGIHERAPLPVSRGLKVERELRLHLEDGTGRLLLPGSSLKGALKTLWISEKLKRSPSRGAAAFQDILQEALYQADLQGRTGELCRPAYNAQALEREVLGGTFDEDAWARIRVGDAAFAEGIAQRISIRNYESENGFEAWNDKRQHWLIETIAPGSQAQLRMDWPWFEPWGRPHVQAGADKWTPARSRPPEPATLLRACRDASARILAAELRFWEDDPNQHQMTEFIAQLRAVAARLSACTEDECVLRIGYGSGFHAITGRIPWDHLTDDRAWAAFFAQLRKRIYPADVPTPKTRKLAAQQCPLGFLHLRWLRS